MNQNVALKLEERTAHGSRAAAKLRREGYVPAVLYGHKVASQSVVVPYRDIAKAYSQAGKHSPVELSIDGKKRLAMFKRVDIEPVKHKLLHVGFHVVKQNEKVQTEVAVHVSGEGESPAEKAGLVLIKNVDIVQIEAFPRDLPEGLEVDGTKLAEAGDTLTVADVVVPDGVTILSDDTQVIASAVEPAALAAANDAAGGTADEETEVEAENGGEEGTETEGEGEEASAEGAEEKPAE